MTEPLLEVRDLSVRFRTDDGPVHAVDSLSFSLNRGEVLAVVGESGCGKSVTALALMGLLPEAAEVTSGQVLLDGVDLLTLPPGQLRAMRGRDVSMVFQEPMTSLNPVLRIGRQVGEVVRRHEGVSRQAGRARAIELLGLVGIPDAGERVDDYPHQLSGGMRQRVMIAIGLACNPQVLIADEPTTALDVTIQAGILDLMREVRDEFGTSIVMITHDLGVVAEMADRSLVMYAGRKVEEAAVGPLFADPQHPYTMGLLGAVPRPNASATGDRTRRLTEIKGRVPVLREPTTRCTFADRCGRADEQSRSEVPELREVRPGHAVACFHPGREGATP